MLSTANTSTLEYAGVIFGASGALTVFIRELFRYLAARAEAEEQQEHIDGLTRIARIYDELNQIIASDSGISRVMVIRSSNGGDIPKPGCRVFIRVLHEAYRSLHDSIIHSNLWEERQADQHYIELVRRIAIEEEVLLLTEDLPEESALRALYDASRTHHSHVYRLRLTGTEMLYLSVNYTNPEPPEAMARAVLGASVAGLRNLFR